MRKIEVDNEGNIFHIFEIHGEDYSTSGIEIDESSKDFHQEFMDNHNEYIDIYKYEDKKIVKRSFSEYQQRKQNNLNLYTTEINRFKNKNREVPELLETEKEELETSLENIKSDCLDNFPTPPINMIKDKNNGSKSSKFINYNN